MTWDILFMAQPRHESRSTKVTRWWQVAVLLFIWFLVKNISHMPGHLCHDLLDDTWYGYVLIFPRGQEHTEDTHVKHQHAYHDCVTWTHTLFNS